MVSKNIQYDILHQVLTSVERKLRKPYNSLEDYITELNLLLLLNFLA